MEGKLISSLKIIGYEITENAFEAALQEAPKSIEYSKIVNFITNELRSLCSIDEEVNVITTPEDSISFLLEVSSFLKELGCPHGSLAQGPLSERLSNIEDKLVLLDYLLSELMASRILQQGKPDKQIQLKLQETPEANNLLNILKTLRCSKPPENVTLKDLFEKLLLRAETVVMERGKELVGNPIWNHQLTDKQWNELSHIQKELHSEYTIRRKMMLQRLDCTIQSFQWSDRMKSKGDLIMKTYTEKRKQLKVEPDVDISSLLSAREDLAIIEKTSNSSVRKNTRSQVNKVVIGKVPDRGGRTSEQAAPAPEMPSWQQRQAGPSGGRGGPRGGGGRGRGDFGSSGRGRGDQGGYHRGGGSSHNDRQHQNYAKNDRQYQNQGNDDRQYQNYGNNDRQHQRHYQQNFDSAGSYNTSYHQGSGSYNNSQNQQYSQQQEYYQQEAKRPKTYDSFQSQKQTHVDQFVQESQYNQQYQPRNNRGGGGRGRGRNNYHRGGSQNYY